MLINFSRIFCTLITLVIGVFVVQNAGIMLNAGDKPVIDPAVLERTRESVRMLDDLYKTAVVSITDKYIEDQLHTPAAAVAKDVFKAMKAKGWHSARLVDATGKPKNEDNLPHSDFEKNAVAQIKLGKANYEEIGEVNGKPMLRVGTVVPGVMKQCAVCHGTKDGKVQGDIIYVLPIK
ncbi:MAG TPA: DUF3365 domain-containing protein [Gemmatales bacterium]|nr:DUF3365 domain-containing protein [Gemmatales bacterium]